MKSTLSRQVRTSVPEREGLENLLACVRCGFGRLEPGDHSLVCRRCGRVYPVREGKVFFCLFDKDWPVDDPAATDPSTWTGWRRANFSFFERELATISDHSRLLDLGVGEAHFRSLMGRFFHVGLDFQPHTHARIVSDLRDPLPFKDNSLDVVVASNVLEHVKDPQFVLEECKRVLSPGGRIVITVPFLLHVHQAPYDFYRYTQFMLRELLERAAFDDICIVPLGASSDVLKTMRGHFYTQLCDHNRGMRRLAVRLLYNIYKIIYLIEIALSKTLPSSEEYTPGYGAVATA